MRAELKSSGIRTRSKPDDAVVIVNTVQLGGNGDVILPYPLFGTVSDFLDELYGHVSHVVPMNTFGIRWALRDSETGREFREMGRTWAEKNLRTHSDERPLEEVGIKPGMKVEAISLTSDKSAIAGTT